MPSQMKIAHEAAYWLEINKYYFIKYVQVSFQGSRLKTFINSSIHGSNLSIVIGTIVSDTIDSPFNFII